jgi:hypothetical protein
MAKPSVAKRLLLGLVVLVSIPVVGWFSFNYQVLVGVAVTLIYGSGALLIGGMSLISGIALGAERQLPEGDPEPIPAASLFVWRRVFSRRPADRGRRENP